MNIELIKKLSESIAHFCRANTNRKTNLPIRSSEMGVLIYIKENAKDIGVRLVEISDYFGIQKSSVSTILASLEKNEYIYKTSILTDKRSTPLFLTTKGIQLVEGTIQEFHHTSRQILEYLGDIKCEEFINMLELTTNLIQNGGLK